MRALFSPFGFDQLLRDFRARELALNGRGAEESDEESDCERPRPSMAGANL
jgi:hypothetical protein